MSDETHNQEPVADLPAGRKRGRPKGSSNPLQPVTLSMEQLTTLLDTMSRHTAATGPSPEASGAVESIRMLRDEIARTTLRDNAAHPQVSPFNPLGEKAHPRPDLVYETYFCQMRQFKDALTRSEIELFNAFTSDKTARDGAWTATIKKSGQKQQLLVSVPCNNMDDRTGLPALTAILLELLHGQEVSDPVKAYDRIVALEAQVQALQARATA